MQQEEQHPGEDAELKAIALYEDSSQVVVANESEPNGRVSQNQRKKKKRKKLSVQNWKSLSHLPRKSNPKKRKKIKKTRKKTKRTKSWKAKMV
jgi:hypothetical protein